MAFRGSYGKIAPTLFAKEKVDRFFLEYDDERSGDFKALENVPQGDQQVVLGIFTSKHGVLEDKEAIKTRIKGATPRYIKLVKEAAAEIEIKIGIDASP